jgi:opacity protein-like surface antigen
MNTAMTVVAIAIGACLVPAPARADWTLSPFAGAQLGEVDLGYAPEFFTQNGFLTERRMITIMGNAVAGIPWGGSESFKPYVSGGLGVIHPKVSEAGGLVTLDRRTFGMNVGGGATGWINRSVGLRGDVRYFRGLRSSDDDANAFGVDLSTFHFWRTSAGLSVRF